MCAPLPDELSVLKEPLLAPVPLPALPVELDDGLVVCPPVLASSPDLPPLLLLPLLVSEPVVPVPVSPLGVVLAPPESTCPLLLSVPVVPVEVSLVSLPLVPVSSEGLVELDVAPDSACVRFATVLPVLVVLALELVAADAVDEVVVDVTDEEPPP
ncbi:hypothetical protein AAC03nite_05400 [Alicyclobacillus acidoterrestris]|nr:hypothetical protein AAC03nite_05400 [Alicyclobacillus acidoterrestris]